MRNGKSYRAAAKERDKKINALNTLKNMSTEEKIKLCDSCFNNNSQKIEILGIKIHDFKNQISHRKSKKDIETGKKMLEIINGQQGKCKGVDEIV